MRTLLADKKAISNTKEDYLRAIFLLKEGEKKVGVTQIAEKLKLSKSTVSERLKDLAKDGLVVANHYAEVDLTKTGFSIGEKLTYKHRLIEVFLHQVLHLEIEEVHIEAEHLEHAFSDKVTARLAEFLNYPKNDPHGAGLPKIKFNQN